MTTASFQLTKGRSFRPVRSAHSVVEPADMVSYRNAHRVAGWALALTVTAALWAVPVVAVSGIVALF